ncbi:MAG: hypothetical protein GF375_05145 [Candidatus Omnitrophica bacterium]|nr:hypothetical protein [Candidatus Omnitrophota bacterium]MBD3269378.1 hypothetical protein [Candidatus Omnitrophota bacterium]
MENKNNELKNEILKVGRRLYQQGLAVAKSGNISAKTESKKIFITAGGTYLGNLTSADIVEVALDKGEYSGEKPPSSELPLHTLVYKNFPVKVVVHCHAPLINGYFAVADSLKALSFETKFYLGKVPVVEQDTPTVTKPEKVIEALKTNNIVVLKNHGVVAISDTFNEAMALIESLEEAVRTAAVARLFDKSILDDLDKALSERISPQSASYPMFSPRHIEKIVELVNNDNFISEKGEELDLTVTLAIKLKGENKAYRFNFKKGKIVELDHSADAPFVISADKDIWKEVFLGKIDPFVAVTQGKMQLDGNLGMLSRWYVPFSRLFELFKQVDFI